MKARRKNAKLERQRHYETAFMNGKQIRVKCPHLLDGMSVDKFITENTDMIFYISTKCGKKSMIAPFEVFIGSVLHLLLESKLRFNHEFTETLYFNGKI